jgi:putative flippase GtrA
MEGQVSAWQSWTMHSKLLPMSNRLDFRQIVRYGVVGLLSNLTGYSIYLLLTYMGTDPKITMSALYLIGATVSFFGNRRITFSHAGSGPKAAIRFGLVYFLGYLLNLTLLIVFVDKLGYPHQLIQAISIFSVAALLFLSLKFFVFFPGKATSVSSS